MAAVFLGLGSNLGDCRENLNKAIELLSQSTCKVIAVSAFRVTEPSGFYSKHDFLNAAIEIETSLSPDELLNQTQHIEREMGRTEKSVNGNYHDRIIDIDILLYNDSVIDMPTLKIPHPLMHKRLFVMEPLAEIAPNFVHPTIHHTLYYIYNELKTCEK